MEDVPDPMQKKAVGILFKGNIFNGNQDACREGISRNHSFT